MQINTIYWMRYKKLVQRQIFKAITVKNQFLSSIVITTKKVIKKKEERKCHYARIWLKYYSLKLIVHFKIKLLDILA